MGQVRRRSRRKIIDPITSLPSASNASHRWEPRNPPPPSPKSLRTHAPSTAPLLRTGHIKKLKAATASRTGCAAGRPTLRYVNPCSTHRLRIIQIPPIDHDRIPHRRHSAYAGRAPQTHASPSGSAAHPHPWPPHTNPPHSVICFDSGSSSLRPLHRRRIIRRHRSSPPPAASPPGRSRATREYRRSRP